MNIKSSVSLTGGRCKWRGRKRVSGEGGRCELLLKCNVLKFNACGKKRMWKQYSLMSQAASNSPLSWWEGVLDGSEREADHETDANGMRPGRKGRGWGVQEFQALLPCLGGTLTHFHLITVEPRGSQGLPWMSNWQQGCSFQRTSGGERIESTEDQNLSHRNFLSGSLLCPFKSSYCMYFPGVLL